VCPVTGTLPSDSHYCETPFDLRFCLDFQVNREMWEHLLVRALVGLSGRRNTGTLSRSPRTREESTVRPPSHPKGEISLFSSWMTMGLSGSAGANRSAPRSTSRPPKRPGRPRMRWSGSLRPAVRQVVSMPAAARQRSRGPSPRSLNENIKGPTLFGCADGKALLESVMAGWPAAGGAGARRTHGRRARVTLSGTRVRSSRGRDHGPGARTVARPSPRAARPSAPRPGGDGRSPASSRGRQGP
jgi:hypothetical protein